MGQPQGGISFRRRPRWGSEPTATCSRGSNSTAGSRAVLRLWRVSSVMCAASGQAVEVIDRGCTRAPDPVRVRHGEHYVKPLWAPSGRRTQRPAHADRDRAHRLQPQPAAAGHGRPLRARVPNPVRVRHGEHYVEPRGALGQRAPRPAHPDRDQPYRPQPQPAAAGHPRPLRADVVNRQETRPRILEPALAGRPLPDYRGQSGAVRQPSRWASASDFQLAPIGRNSPMCQTRRIGGKRQSARSSRNPPRLPRSAAARGRLHRIQDDIIPKI
jgi:hypothetical protein